MKIAVCMSGQPRTIAQVWRTLHFNFLKSLDYDLFIHSSEYYPVEADFFTTLQPRIYRVEKQYAFPELVEQMAPIYFNAQALKGNLQQAYAWKRVFQLKDLYSQDHNIVYDVVVRLRPDIEYLSPITLDMFDLTKINYFPRIADPERNQCPTDVFAIGPDTLMNKLGELFGWLPGTLPTNYNWTGRLPAINAEVCGGKHSPESVLATFLADVPCCPAVPILEDVIRLAR